MTPQMQIARLAGNGGMYIGEARHVGSARLVRFEDRYTIYWHDGDITEVKYRRMIDHEHARAVVRVCAILSAAFAQEGAA